MELIVQVKNGVAITTNPGQRVHQHCRRDFCDPKRIANETAAQSNKVEKCSSLRSHKKLFDFSKHCMFCGNPAKYDG